MLFLQLDKIVHAFGGNWTWIDAAYPDAVAHAGTAKAVGKCYKGRVVCSAADITSVGRETASADNVDDDAAPPPTHLIVHNARYADVTE